MSARIRDASFRRLGRTIPPVGLWEASPVPWLPELFSAPTVEEFRERKERDRLITVPYFVGVMSGETDALVESFAGEPELHHPVRGRIKGARAFGEFAAETKAWLERRQASIEDINHIRLERTGVGEVILHLGGPDGRVDLPVATVADRGPDGHIEELRMYYSSWPLTGHHATRTPMLQPDPDPDEPDVVGAYQRALAAGDLDAIVASFEADGYAREPAGDDHLHRGPDGLRRFYEWMFSNEGGIPLEHCAVADDGRACALEYNVVRWGQAELPPEAGIAVYVRGESGKLAAARIYDDADPPLGPLT
jgi:hypothetical protein